MSRGRRSALVAALLALATLGFSAYVLRGQILERWRIIEFDRAPEKDRWELAEKLRTLGPAGGERAESWYLERFEANKQIDDRTMNLLADMGSVRFLERLLGRYPGGSWGGLARKIFEQRPKDSLRVFESALRDPAVKTQGCAIFVLQDLGPRARAAVRALIPIAADLEHPLHLDAIRAVRALGPSPGEALAAYSPAIRERSNHTAIEALWSAVQLHEEAAPFLPDILEALDRSQDAARAEILRCLAFIGKPARSALPCVHAVLEEARAAMSSVGPSEAVSAVFEAALDAIDQVDAHGDAVVCELLRKDLADSRTPVRRNALQYVEGRGRFPVSALLKAVLDRDAIVQREAWLLLRKVAPRVLAGIERRMTVAPARKNHREVGHEP